MVGIAVAREIHGGAPDEREAFVAAREKLRAEDGAVPQLGIGEPDERRPARNEPIEPGV